MPTDETQDPEEDDCALRCVCGCLLARHVPGGIELKCRRCKRTIIVPLSESGSADPEMGDAFEGGDLVASNSTVDRAHSVHDRKTTRSR